MGAVGCHFTETRNFLAGRAVTIMGPIIVEAVAQFPTANDRNVDKA